MEHPCAACRKPVDWLKGACPYCKAERPPQAPAPEPRLGDTWIQLTVAVTLGLAAGTIAGGVFAPRALLTRRLLAAAQQPNAEALALRQRVRDLADKPPAGFQYRTVAELRRRDPSEGAVRVVTIGILGSTEFHSGRGSTLQLWPKWASPEGQTIDATVLSHPEKKALFRAHFPPSLVAVYGTAGPAGFVAERTEVLGHPDNNDAEWFGP